MVWTAEAIEDLKRLALEGRSAAVIAATLGVGSRNAVIGKASRIGIKLNGGGRTAVSGNTRAGAYRAQWATVRPAPSGGSKPNSAAALARGPEAASADQRATGWTFGEARVGEMRRLRFEDIRESVCRWPLGDPKTGDFAYCGLQPVEGHSYCAGHCRIAYRPPQARRIAREQQGLRTIANSWRLT
jgi:GcrA cell cycle regulator